MSILDITKDSIIPLVDAEYEVIVNMTTSYTAADPFIKNKPYNCFDIQNQLKADIMRMESIGPNMANIKALLRDITTNHEKLFINTTTETDMYDNIHTWFLHLKSTTSEYNILSVILRKRSAWYGTARH